MLLKKLLNMKGKDVLITGGSSYLGTAICETLAEYGANLFIGSRSFENNISLSDKLSDTYGNRNTPLRIDISDSESINKSINEIIKNSKKIDVLINNAYYGAGKELTSMTDEEWYKGIDGTINGVYRCTKAVLPYMLERKSGKIVNIASMYGIVSPDTSIYQNNDFYNPANYASGKAAIIHFTKYIAAVYGKFGINSNSISPGPFPDSNIQKNKDFINKIVKKVPLKRIGNPDDLKGVILLLSSNASDYINGTNIVIDGGWTIW